MTAIGNRSCPIDLTGNASRVHGPRDRRAATLDEMQEVFVDHAGFSAVHALNLSGHFGMTTLVGPLTVAAALLGAYWQWIAVPERRWLYASPLNPTLMLWIEK